MPEERADNRPVVETVHSRSTDDSSVYVPDPSPSFDGSDDNISFASMKSNFTGLDDAQSQQTQHFMTPNNSVDEDDTKPKGRHYPHRSTRNKAAESSVTSDNQELITPTNSKDEDDGKMAPRHNPRRGNKRLAIRRPKGVATQKKATEKKSPDQHRE